MFIIPPEDIRKLRDRFIASNQQLRDVAFFMKSQVDDRFRTQGASGSAPWPPKKLKEWGADDYRSILTGASGHLRASFLPVATDKVAMVGSWAPYAVIQQLGTIGKGGQMPTIRPKKAKALFIPITDKAINSVRLTGKEAGSTRLLHKLGESLLGGAYRTGTKESRKNKTTSFVKLKKGRLKNGKLEVWDERAGEYKPGKPDFIFLSKVDLPPRPMLPTSPRELTATTKFFAEKLLGG